MGKSKTAIIIGREFGEKVRSKSFLVSTIVVPLLIAAVCGVAAYISSASIGKAKRIMVSDASGVVAPALENSRSVEFEPVGMSLDEFRAEQPDVFGLLVVESDIVDDPTRLKLYTYKSATMELENAITRQVSDIVERERLRRCPIDDLQQIMDEIRAEAEVESYELSAEGGEARSSSGLSQLLAMFVGLLMVMFVSMYGNMVMQGVVEEKSSKVLEVMVSSVKPFELMMGKILGVASVAVTQFAIWAVLIAAAGAAVMHGFAAGAPAETLGTAAGLDPGMALPAGGGELGALAAAKIADPLYAAGIVLCFIVFFLGGYLLYAAIFAAIGSAVDNVQDTQQLQTPVTVFLMASYVVLFSVMKDPYSPLALWGSMIPFSSPVIMLARIPYGVPLWQVVLSAALLYASFVAMVWFAGRVYRVGIFMYGKKPSFGELVRWTRLR